MPKSEPLAITPRTVSEARKRVTDCQRRSRSGHLPPMTKWSRESRFWALRPSLFLMASELEYQAIIRFQKENGGYNFDPNDVAAAEARANKEMAEAGDDIVNRVIRHWNYWVHQPRVIQDILGLDVSDLLARIQHFDRELTVAVAAMSHRASQEHEDIRRAREATHREADEEAALVAELMKAPLRLYRMKTELMTSEGPRLKLSLRLTPEDTRWHVEVIGPILAGLWRLFSPIADPNSLFADHDSGVFMVTTRQVMKVRDHVEDYSRLIEGILQLDRKLVGPLSLTKAAQLLKISANELRDLASVGEIHPISMVTLSSGSLRGVEFMGFAVQDVLDLEAVLDEARNPMSQLPLPCEPIAISLGMNIMR